MRYDLRKILGTTALALVLGFAATAQSYAQGVISLNDSAANETNADDIPNEISLFGDDTPDIITPAKPTPKVIEKKVETKVENKVIGEKSAAPVVKTTEVKTVTTVVKKSPSPLALDVDEKPQPSVLNIPAPQPQAPAPVVLPAPANIPAPTAAAPAAAPAPVVIPAAASTLDNRIVADIDDDVFNQMSNLEKETAILNLELRKEQVKNSIEALKSVQAKAREEENAKKEEERRKTIEFEKEQERKVIQEQQKLKNLELQYEKARQEKLLKAYKNKMLEERQAFIQGKADVYKEVAELRNDRQKLVNDFKGRFIQLTKLADQATNDAIRARDNQAKIISDLQTQISILRARLEASENANPFAENGADGEGGGEGVSARQEEPVARLNDLYAIMEVRGKGDKLSAKLINDKGNTFMVKVGTVLQTGHIVDEIDTTYVRADKEGNKEYLYFSAGGILEKEPTLNEEIKVKVSESGNSGRSSGGPVASQGIPGVAREMTIR